MKISSIYNARVSLWILCACLLLCDCNAATADSLVFSPTSGNAAAGGTFSFTVSLNTTHPFYGFDLYLDASAGNSFSVTGEGVAASSPITSSNFVGSFPVLLTTSGNSPDFGYSSTGTSDIAAGNYTIGTLTLSVGANVPKGSFIIDTTTGASGCEYGDIEGHTYQLPQASYTLSVPEPGGVPLALVLTASIVALQSRFRKNSCRRPC